jgi:four helix bundle protein
MISGVGIRLCSSRTTSPGINGTKEKDQIPTSNIQRIAKDRTRRNAARSGVVYEEPLGWGSSLRVAEGETNGAPKHAFDLEERTAVFGERIVRFSKRIPRDPTNNRLIDQVVGCGTSVGANYCEANEGVSAKDFRHIIGGCVKEAKEAKFFLRMIAASEPTLATSARELYSEAKELHLIFASIFRKTRPPSARS